MPHGDGTGPAGYGPMSGRAAGYCAGFPLPGFTNPVAGRERRGRGRGWRRRYWATGLPGWMRPGWIPGFRARARPERTPPYASPFHGPQTTPEHELQALKEQADYFEDALERIRSRMDEIDAARDGKDE